MATTDTMTPVREAGATGQSPGRRPWVAAVIALLAVAAVGFGALWLSERSAVSDLEGDLATAEAAVAEATAAEAAAVAELAAFNHPEQEGVQALYEAFLAAVANPDAATIESLLTSNAVNNSAEGITTRGAEAIGAGYEAYGPIVVVDTDGLIINGTGRTLRAAMQGQAFGVDGLLVTTIKDTSDGLKFSEIIWYGG